MTESTDSTDSTSTPENQKFKIWLDEVGIEIGREVLDAKDVPFLNDDGNLVIPHQSLKFKKQPKVKEVHYKIYLGEDNKPCWAEIRGKGKVPSNATRDKNDDTVIPFEKPVYRIFLDKDGGEMDRQINKGLGRSPKGSTTDADGNVVVSWAALTGTYKDETPAPVVVAPAAPVAPAPAETEKEPVDAA